MKFPKLYLAVSQDDYRPVMQFARVQKDFTYATEVHIIVRHKTEEIFPLDFYKSIPENGIALPYHILKAICNSAIKDMQLISEGKQIKLIRKDYNIIFDLPDPSEFNFPDYEKVLSAERTEEKIDLIALNPDLLNRLTQAMGNSTNIYKLKFYGADKNILVEPNNEFSDYRSVKGLIMPCIIH